MKDNSPLFHSFLLFLFVAVLGYLTLNSGSPKQGLLRPGTRAPEPFVIQQKAEHPTSETETAAPEVGTSEEKAPEAPAEGGWN